MSKNENKYKISVVIPTLNRINTLQRALDSVINQTYKPAEIIVVDNGSSDGTLKFLREQYPKITILTENKIGVSSARNKGIKKSINQWIALLDSDDAWHPRKLEIQTSMLDSALKEYNLIHTDEVWFRNNKHINQMKKHKKQGGYIFERCLSLCCISPSSVLFKKNILDKVGLFDESLPVCEDYDMWLKICSSEEVLFAQDKLTYKYGGHKDQLSKSYWGMDRFRIKSIENIIKNFDLTYKQKKQAKKELIKKLKIIINGAFKRNNLSIVNEFSTKLEYWDKVNF
jgi:glycosyltransferase involved in cell wall biosynthesis|tara:strand:- start:288 stop:1142 length:855 start_codon:yes stop_codon:yes gene_type:complete